MNCSKAENGMRGRPGHDSEGESRSLRSHPGPYVYASAKCLTAQRDTRLSARAKTEN